MTNEIIEKLTAVLEDEAFAAELVNKETVEEAKAALAAKGVALTDEQMNELGALIEKAQSEELNEEALDSVAGGAIRIVRLFVRLPRTVIRFNWVQKTRGGCC